MAAASTATITWRPLVFSPPAGLAYQASWPLTAGVFRALSQGFETLDCET